MDYTVAYNSYILAFAYQTSIYLTTIDTNSLQGYHNHNSTDQSISIDCIYILNISSHYYLIVSDSIKNITIYKLSLTQLVIEVKYQCSFEFSGKRITSILEISNTNNSPILLLTDRFGISYSCDLSAVLSDVNSYPIYNMQLQHLSLISCIYYDDKFKHFISCCCDNQIRITNYNQCYNTIKTFLWPNDINNGSPLTIDDKPVNQVKVYVTFILIHHNHISSSQAINSILLLGFNTGLTIAYTYIIDEFQLLSYIPLTITNDPIDSNITDTSVIGIIVNNNKCFIIYNNILHIAVINIKDIQSNTISYNYISIRSRILYTSTLYNNTITEPVILDINGNIHNIKDDKLISCGNLSIPTELFEFNLNCRESNNTIYQSNTQFYENKQKRER